MIWRSDLTPAASVRRPLSTALLPFIWRRSGRVRRRRAAARQVGPRVGASGPIPASTDLPARIDGGGRRPALLVAPVGQSGFTLIEMIVVLVILGLSLSIVAGFSPRRNTTLELSAATGRVSMALRLARSRAMTEDRPVTFSAAVGGHGFRVDNETVSL